MSTCYLKYDVALGQVIELDNLKPADFDQAKPVNFRDRISHYLPPDKNSLQHQMNQVHKFSTIQKFQINETKTQTVVFSAALSKDFYPRIKNANGEFYNNVEEFKCGCLC